MSDTSSNVVDLSTSKGTMVLLPGADKPVPLENLLTRDQHLAAANQQAERFKREYGEAIQLADLLSTDEGTRRFAQALVEQGFAGDLQPATNGSAPTGNAKPESKPDNGGEQPPQWFQVHLAEMNDLKKQNNALMQQVALMGANAAVEKEVEKVRAVRPDADLGVLATKTSELRSNATLLDALRLGQADDLEAENAKLKERIARMEMAAKVPGFDALYESGDDGGKRKEITPENRESALIAAVKKAAAAAT